MNEILNNYTTEEANYIRIKIWALAMCGTSMKVPETTEEFKAFCEDTLKEKAEREAKEAEKKAKRKAYREARKAAKERD